MKKAIAKAAITIGAALTSGALVYAAKDSMAAAAYLLFITVIVFGFLSFVVDVES